MLYHKITPEFLEKLSFILPGDAIILDESTKNEYAHDETEDFHFLPEVVLKPENAGQISEIVKLCNAYQVPVTPRGGGTGLSGGALPIYGGVLLSVERMNKIIELDEANLQLTCESGVITEILINKAAEKNLLYPVDPSSKGSCFIGGNIAHGSGGPRVVKYGTLRDYVLNLEVVLPGGEIIWTGANTIKYASGYNLTQLMIGSEGTLGIITKAVLKLIPRPTRDYLLLAMFKNAKDACIAVAEVFKAGITPSALEFMEIEAVAWGTRFTGIKFPVKENIGAYLLIEVDGHQEESLLRDCEVIGSVMEKFGAEEVLFADSALQKEEWWKLRRNIAHAVKANSIYKEEDTVVPRAMLPKLLEGIKQIGAEYGFQSVCYGHAGDGNLHINIIKGTMTDHDWKNKLPVGIRKLFELTVNLGGTISGEHGIGYVQKTYMDVKYSSLHIHLMKLIKRAFDPKLILNPGKIFDE